MEQNKEIIRKLYYEALIGWKNTGSAGEWSVSRHSISPRASGLEAFNQFFAALGVAFTDHQLAIQNLVCKEDMVMANYTISGTQVGHFMGVPPTNQKMVIAGVDVFRLDQGRVVEHWDGARQISAGHQLPGIPAVPYSVGRPRIPAGVNAAPV